MEILKQNQNHNYEIMYIVDDQNQERAQLIKKEFSEILTENGGTIKKEENVIRKFAYPISNKVKGHYFIIEVSTSLKNIANFNRIALIKQKQLEIMRFLVINLDSEKINNFKVRRQTENSSYYASRTSNRLPYNNRDGETERKPRPIAGVESSYRPKTNYVNQKPVITPVTTDKKD